MNFKNKRGERQWELSALLTECLVNEITIKSYHKKHTFHITGTMTLMHPPLWVTPFLRCEQAGVTSSRAHIAPILDTEPSVSYTGWGGLCQFGDGRVSSKASMSSLREISKKLKYWTSNSIAQIFQSVTKSRKVLRKPRGVLQAQTLTAQICEVEISVLICDFSASHSPRKTMVSPFFLITWISFGNILHHLTTLTVLQNV